MNTGNLSPTVLWAQRKHFILLRVQVKSLKKPDFNIHETHMTFKVDGEGLSGRATYSFQLVFYEPVNTEHCRVRFFENEVEFRIVKKHAHEWPRIVSTLERPHWLRVDFDHWEELSDGEEGEEDEVEGEQGEKRALAREKLASIKEEQAKMISEMERVKNEASQSRKTVSTAKTLYLLIYNGVQWAGFILIVVNLLKSLTKGREGITSAYDSTSFMLMFCQTVMLLEILHSAMGLVKSSIMTAFLQLIRMVFTLYWVKTLYNCLLCTSFAEVFGRFLVLFAVLHPSVEIHDHPIVFMLFLVWSLIEIFRYPYYILSVLEMEAKVLTWLRYIAWIPLYPIGFTCEATILWLSIPHFKESGDYQLSLPNSYNFSFDPVTVLWIGICFVPLIAFVEIRHMYYQMKKRLAKLKSE